MQNNLTDERQKGWFWDVNDIFESDLSVYAIAVRVFLARCADKHGRSFPSFNKIAEKCSISRRQAINAVQELIAKGWLDKVPRRAEGESGGSYPASNLYILKDPKRGARDAPGGSEQGALVQDMHQGSAHDAPGVVHTVHPKDYPLIKDYPDKDDPNSNVCSSPDADEGAAEKANPGRHDYSSEFEQFWSVYPRKREKQRAYRAWQARMRAGVPPNDLIAAAKAYALECKTEGRPERFIKHGSTFLGPDGSYKDYLDGTAAQERVTSRSPTRRESAAERLLREEGVI